MDFHSSKSSSRIGETIEAVIPGAVEVKGTSDLNLNFLNKSGLFPNSLRAFPA